jgi:hypothetical protein
MGGTQGRNFEGRKMTVDTDAWMHHDAFMRTTIDIPDDLYRTLKARAGLSGVTLRQLLRQLIEQGLRSPRSEPSASRRVPPPVIIPPRGVPIPAVSREEIRRIEEEEDEAKYAGPP